jgi:hypothetical protein
LPAAELNVKNINGENYKQNNFLCIEQDVSIFGFYLKIFNILECLSDMPVLMP